jgi:hypothetical protein
MFPSLPNPRSVIIPFERSFHRLSAVRLKVSHQHLGFFARFLRIPLAEIRNRLAFASD